MWDVFRGINSHFKCENKNEIWVNANMYKSYIYDYYILWFMMKHKFNEIKKNNTNLFKIKTDQWNQFIQYEGNVDSYLYFLDNMKDTYLEGIGIDSVSVGKK